jgi:hypothetical protein
VKYIPRSQAGAWERFGGSSSFHSIKKRYIKANAGSGELAKKYSQAIGRAMDRQDGGLPLPVLRISDPEWRTHNMSHFRAPRSAVWAAWSEHEHFEQWWIPEPINCKTHQDGSNAGWWLRNSDE